MAISQSPSNAMGLPQKARLVETSTPTTGVDEGAVFVSDGSGGLTAGTLYFRPESNGAPVDLLAGGGGTDVNAVHVNVAGEIFAITAKSVLDAGDILLIEDSTAGNAKKSVLVSSLVDSQVLAKTANYTVLSSEEGSLYTNEGAASEIDFTLPPASTGLGPFHFYNLDANGLRIIAGAGDTIRIGVGSVTAAAGNIKPQNPTDIGASVTLVAVNATQWVQMSLDGSWTAT